MDSWLINGKGCVRKKSWPVTSNYAGIRLEVLRETLNHPSENSLCPGRDSNRTTREYKPQALANLISLWLCSFRNIIWAINTKRMRWPFSTHRKTSNAYKTLNGRFRLGDPEIDEGRILKRSSRNRIWGSVYDLSACLVIRSSQRSNKFPSSISNYYLLTDDSASWG